MAVKTVIDAESYIGLSTDTKPNGRPGELFHEVNTGITYIWHDQWVEDLRMIYAMNMALKG